MTAARGNDFYGKNTLKSLQIVRQVYSEFPDSKMK